LPLFLSTPSSLEPPERPRKTNRRCILSGKPCSRWITRDTSVGVEGSGAKTAQPTVPSPQSAQNARSGVARAAQLFWRPASSAQMPAPRTPGHVERPRHLAGRRWTLLASAQASPAPYAQRPRSSKSYEVLEGSPSWRQALPSACQQTCQQGGVPAKLQQKTPSKCKGPVSTSMETGPIL